MMSANRWPFASGRLLLSLSALVFLIATLAAPGALAQLAGGGNINGTVSDPSGAVIPNAQVTLTEESTGVKHTTTTTSGGVFGFPNIPVGTYDLAVTSAGFKKYSQTHIVLEVGGDIGINVKMQVGAATQQVQVQANGLALQTQDVTFKQTIDRKEINELPLNGRQMTSLIILSGGSAQVPDSADLTGSKNFYSSVPISVAGGMGNMTDYRLDGGDNNDYMTNVNLPFPFPDAVSQFSVETSVLGAQSGLHPGGEVNVVTVSGTNHFHGDAFEFIRNNYIDATNFFSSTPDQLHQNQFGGTIGGPILRDKLFFFAGYQRLDYTQSQSNSQAYVPTAANLAGDFSVTDGATCTANHQTYQLLNPLTGAVLPGDKINPGTFTTQSLAILKYLPPTSDPCGLVFYSIPLDRYENQFVTRIDATLSPRNNLYGRYFLDGYSQPAFYSPTNALITSQYGNEERVQTLTVGDNFVFTPTTVNSLHLTVDRRRNDRGAAADGINPGTVGINMYVPTPNFFRLTLSNKWSLYCSTCSPAYFNVNTFAGSDDVNLVRGKHQIVFGGEYARSQFNANNTYEENGDFTFTGIFSQKGPAGTSPGGTGADANLDYLTGAMQAFEQSKAQENALRAPIPTLYIQDTYQATPRLVVTAGVRWQPEYMPTDYFHRGAAFSESNFLNNVSSGVFPNAPAGTLFYGDKGIPKNFTQNSIWQFSPRLGVTWNPGGNGKIDFRGGWAIMYDEPNFFTAQRLQQNPPYATAVSNVPTSTPLDFASPWTGGSNPGNVFPLPFTPPANTTFPNSAQYIYLPSHFYPPYVMMYTASMQQELAHNWMAEIDYIGNHTIHDAFGVALDPARFIPGTCGAGPCSTLGNTSSRFNLTLLNPAQGPKYTGGNNGTTLISDGATAAYNGMIATIQHRLSNFSFLANYTWSHCIDVADAQGDIAATIVEDPYDPRLDRGNCGFDFRSMFNANAVATSHFTSLHGWSSRLVNNWEIAPIVRITDGTPFNVVTGVDNSLTDINEDRPNLIPGVPVYTRKSITQTNAGNRQFINPNAFTPNATGTYGNLGRDAFRGPNYADVDAEISRFFPLTERAKLDLRLESFNVLNHPQFSPPSSGSIISSTFGQVTSTGGNNARLFQGAVKIIF